MPKETRPHQLQCQLGGRRLGSSELSMPPGVLSELQEELGLISNDQLHVWGTQYLFEQISFTRVDSAKGHIRRPFHWVTKGRGQS